MSTTDPTGEGGGGGGGGGGGEGATTTNVEQTASPSTPITGTAAPVPAGTQQQQHPPPSPLSGCYLLVVLPEPHTAQHKDLILNRLAKGFLSWDKDSCHVDLEKELLALVAQAPEGEEARNGERLIQYATENLVTEVLIHPQTNTLLQCIRNLLASFTKHRHIIHAGYTFGGNGSWILQDGTFSLADFLDAFSEHEVQRVLRAYENSVTVDIHCAGVGDWTTGRLSKEACCRSCRVRVNPDDVLTAGVPAITSFTNYIGQYLVAQTLDQLMEPSDVVGNIRFSHPTLYVFPGGQGDAALFGINGFNMLVDGGFARKACFWDFTRHLDRLDAVLVTRINNSNIGGMFSVLRKKKEMHVYPQIGHFFCNLVERRQSNSPDGDKDIDPLILNLTDIGQEMVLNLRHISLRAHPCYRDPEPINLYHKVGHGTLDMYVLSPSKDSREVREFLTKWHASDSKLFAGSHKKENNITFPIQNLVSICALLVWQPANPEDTITRILFPGSTPQHKIFEGFERLKHLDFLKHPVCSAKTLSPSTSLATLRDKPTKQKLGLIEKEPKRILESRKDKREPSEPKSIKAMDESVSKTTPQSTPVIPTSKPKAEVKTKKVAENRKIETEVKESKKIEPDTKETKKIESDAKESKKIEKELKEVKKEQRKEPAKEKIEKGEKREDDIKKTDLIKSESEKTTPRESKEFKPKPEPKKKDMKESKSTIKTVKGEVTPKPKLSEKKAKPSGVEKKDAMKSSPTTPKKTLNGTATKTEVSKAVPRVRPAAKVTPSLPAKSAKEANNRKVVEQKNIEKSTVKDIAAPAAKVPAKPKPMDRKPISRRTKPVSPSKARMPGSPAKSTRSTPTTSVKSDKDGVIRKVKGDKGTTDSSTVSTPSGIESEAVKPIDKSLIEQSEDISLDSIESKVLADLKEEREVVEEIEAVLQKAERIEETRKDDRFEGDDEITAEATDKKEEDITEEDITAEIEDAPKKESSRKESQELTEEDEYLIVEKEEVYTEDSAQSGEGEQKHVLDEAESEKAKILKDVEVMKEKGEKEEPEEKEKDESPEKKIEKATEKVEKEISDLPLKHKEQLQEEVKEIIASAAEIVQKAEEKDDSGKKDSEDITKEPSSLSPDKLDSSEKKTTDTDMKPDVDQKEHILEKMEESQERISTIESGATTTAPTLPEDERIPLDEIKEDIDEKHVIEEVKEKDAPAKLKEEVVPETIPAAVKPEVKVFDVRQAMQNLQRDIVKTPDEVADLPVHEEVDPKLYRMEDFEKGKEEKPPPAPQEVKEPPTPPVKEQKGVFSFFGKVADKFEKGIDKLTKKSKRDAEKDSDERSSSKSSSPKEAKVQEKTVLEEVDMEKMFPKVSKPADKPVTFEEIKPTIPDVKTAAIKETMAFLQEEIQDAKRKSVPDIEEKLLPDKLEEIKKEDDIETTLHAKDILPATISPSKPFEDQEIAKEIELLKEEGIEEEAEEVKALLEEASKKFKTVKDSLRDSLESLEEKIKEEQIAEMQHEIPSTLKDAVKDTLEGVVEKLEEIQPHIESFSPDIKEPEKVKFDIPKDEEFGEEYEEEPVGPFRDVKEAVRDVGEVLAGTAGIEIDDKPKDVIEIVKKVAEVLKEDDFLSDKVLFDEPTKKEEIPPTKKEEIPPIKKEEISPTKKEDMSPIKKEEISPMLMDRKPSKEKISPVSSIPDEKESPEKEIKLEEKEVKIAHEDIVMPRKVGITEEIPVHEEVEELIQESDKSIAPYEKSHITEVKEEPCIKVVKEQDDIMVSPVKDIVKDKEDAHKICEEMLKDDQHICVHKKPTDDDTSRIDVMQAGIEHVCVKKLTEHTSFEEKSKDDIEQPVISFEQKVSPAKAEIVMVTPDSAPTSPKFSTDKMYDKKLEVDFQKVIELPILPEDVKDILNKEVPVKEILEEFIITKKKKITIEVIEYITVVRRIPRERVIYIIEEIIVKKGLPRESVVDNPEILKVKESITPEKRMEVEDYIVNEYIVKGKRITIQVVEEISIKKIVPKKIVIEIIEEIIVKRKIAKHMVLDVPEEVLSEIVKEESPESSQEESVEEKITPKIDITAKPKPTDEVSSAPTEIKGSIMPQKRTEVEEFIIDEYVTKGKKITGPAIDEISAKKVVPKKVLIEIIEEIIIKKKVPRNAVLEITEEEVLAITKRTPEDEQQMEVPEEILSEKWKSITEVPTAEITQMKEPITSKKRAEVEEYIVNEYVTKGDIITTQKLEEICSKKKIPRRIIMEIIEEIIIKRKIPKHVVLTLTEEELSRIIKEEETPESDVLTEKRKSIVETSSLGEEKKSPIEMKMDKKEDVSDEIVEEELLVASEDEDDEEKLVDGFVSVPRRISDGKVDAKKKAVSPVKAEIAKEHEKDVIDDFEAVEQEYKVHDLPITSPEKADEMKEKEDIEEEAMEDTTSEVIEADEKFVQETKEKIGKEESQIDVAKDVKPADKKQKLGEHETTEVSEIVDTTEKYLDEAKEKADDIVPKDTIAKPISPVCDTAEESSIEADVSETISKSTVLTPKVIDESKTTTEDIKSKPTTPIKDESLKDIEHPSKDVPAEAPEDLKPETKLADATGFKKEPKIELFEDKKMELFETTETRDISMAKDEKDSHDTSDEVLRKMNISKEPEEEEISKTETKLHVEDAAKSPEKDKESIEKSPIDKSLKIDDDIGTVKRMLVTASSEDGKEETEICPTGTITFTKTVTPDDSLKDASIKSTPDKDSLFMDKDSLHSGVSSPEKDSISEKFAPDDKDKIISEDSLEKSPIGIRDSQDLEDSLEKSESRKPKDIEVSSSDVNKEKTLKQLEDVAVLHEDAIEKDKLKSPKEKQERKFSTEDAGEIEKSKSLVKEVSDELEKPESSVKLVDEQDEKSKSPDEEIKDQIEKLKSLTELTTEKIEKPKSPLEEIIKKVEESKITEETDKLKSPKQDIIEIPDMSVDKKIPLELKHEDTQKPTSSVDIMAENSPVESTEKPKIPIEKIFPESGKEGMPSVSKTLESLRSEDISPAETIFSKSPTDKHEMHFSKVAISEEDFIPEKVTEKLPIITKEAKPVTDKDLPTSSEQEKTPIPESKDDQIPEKLEAQESIPKSISSVVVTNELSEKSLDDIPLEKSRSPSISSEKHEEKDASSIASEKSEDKESSVRSKSPDTAGDKPEQVEEKPIEKPRSPSITEKKIDIVDKIDDIKLKSPAESDEIGKRSKPEDKVIAEVELKPETKEPTDRPKSPSVISEESEKDIKSFDKSPSALSDKAEEKEIDKLISPSAIEKETISEKSPILESGHYDEKGPIDEPGSPSAVSDKSDKKKEADRSKSPSITADKLDLQDEMERYLEKPKSPIFDRPESPKAIDKTEEPQDKDRSPSVASDKSDSKKVSDRSRSPSIYIEKIDLKDMDLPIEKARSPSVTSIKDDKLESISRSFIDKAEVPRDEPKASKFDGEDLKDIMQPQLDKSQSPSVTSTISESKELIVEEKSPVTADKTGEYLDKNKLSSPVEWKLDIGDKEPFEKPGLSSIVGEQHLPEKVRKSPSPAEEEPEDLTQGSMGRSVSSSIAHEKLDLKDIAEQPLDKLKSHSAVSATMDQAESLDDSKSPGIVEAKISLKSVTEPAIEKSISSSVLVTEEQIEPTDFSKFSNTIGEKPDLKDVTEISLDKSRSSSVASVQKEPADRSKSPSIAGDKPDMKDVTEVPMEKSKSPSAVSVTSEQKEPIDLSKSPSITTEKSDVKDVLELSSDKSRSPSVISVTEEQKEPFDRSKSPSIAGEKLDLKDVTDRHDEKSRSPSAISTTSDLKESEDRSKSPSIIEEKSDQKDFLELTEKRSRSASVVSITDERKVMADRSKSPSISDEKPDLKDAVAQQTENLSSIRSVTGDQGEPIDGRKSSIIDTDLDTIDKSKSSSIASEKSDDKKLIDELKASIAGDKSDLTDTTEQSMDKFKSLSATDEKDLLEKAGSLATSDKKEEPDRSKSPSMASDKSEGMKSATGSKQSSVAGDAADMKEVLDSAVDKSRSPSIVSVTTDQKELIEKSMSPTISHKAEELHDRSKSPSVVSEKSDGKKSADGSRATSVTEEKPDLKDVMELPVDTSRSPSVTSLTTEIAEPIRKSISPTTSDKLEPVDRSKSPSIASDKSDERALDDKASSKEHYEDAIDKSPSLVDVKMLDKKDVEEKPLIVSEKLDIKSIDDAFEAHDKVQSPNIILDKSIDDKEEIDRADIDGLKISDVSELGLVDKTRSLSIISDKTEPKSPSDVSKSPSSADEKFDQKDKSRSSSVVSEKLDDIDIKTLQPETKGERSISPSSEVGKVPKDGSTKSSRASSPVDKTPKDRSRSQSVFDIGEKTPVSRSRTASLYDDKLSEKVLPQEQKDPSKQTEMEKSLDVQDEYKSSSKDKSPITSPEAIQEELKKIREKRFAYFDEPAIVHSKKIEKSDDEEENIIQVTTEKKAEIEKYILEEFIFKKRKISLVVIEKLVMIYSLPQFIVIEIIEDIIDRQKVPRSSVFDFIDEELITSQHGKESEVETTLHKVAEIEKYIIEEFIVKKKKITPEALEEMIILKSVPRFIIIATIEGIILTRQIPRNTLIEGDLGEPREKSPEIVEKKEKPAIPTSVDLEKISITQEYLRSHGKLSDTMRSESPDGKVSPVGSDRYSRDTKAISVSPSLSPEPIPSDKSTQDSPARSEPHIDEEISISEEKRSEIEKLLEEEYIKKGKKITEAMLEEIIVRTSLPRYIILEIVEEIILKKKIPRESVIDVEIYQEEEPEEDYEKAVYGFDRSHADTDYELSDDARKSSVEYRMYPDTDERQLDKSVTDYPMDYESQFHKAFVGGMTEMRTTHITTLSGKSTPEYATHDATPESGVGNIDKISSKLPERTLTTTHITKTDVDDLKITPSMQTVTILRESKITEPHVPAESPEEHDDTKVTKEVKPEVIHKDESETTVKILKERASDEVSGQTKITSGDSVKPEMDAVKKIVEQEVIEGKEQSQTIKKEMIKETGISDEPKVIESDGYVVKKTVSHEVLAQEKPEAVTAKAIEQDEPEAITKIIKREIVEHGEPEVVTKVVKREIIEQDEPEIIRKVIRREVIAPDEEIGDFKEDSGEFVKTITTKTTRTIVTEELSDAELSQTDPSKIYRDPTSGTTYKVVSEESAPDITASADVKRIVTTVTTITGPDGKVTTMKDVKESSDTVDSDELLEKLIDSPSDKTGKFTTDIKSAEKIVTSMTSGTSTPDVKPFYDSGKSTPDSKQEDKFESAGKERGQERTIGVDKFEHSVSPLVRDLISDDKSYSGKSSPDISLPKDIVFSGSTGKSTPEIPMSPLIRDGAAVQPHLSGRSTPDRRSDGRSSTATPEGFRSGEMIRTIITTTKTISDEGEIVTTTREVTETTNEKGETVVLAQKTNVKVEDSLPSKDAAESAISSIIGSIKSSESQCSDSPGSDDATSEKDRGPTSPPSDRSSVQSKAMTHIWGSSEERHTYSDDEPPSSPLSSTSQVGYSSQMTRRHDPTSDKEEEQKQSVAFSTAAMSSSFYGELPAVPPQISAMKTFHGETGIQKSSDPIHSRFMVEKEFAYGEKPDAKKYVDEADLDFDKALMEHKEMKEANGAFSSGIAPRYTNGNVRHDVEDSTDHPSSSFQDDAKDDSKGDSKKDPLEGWGTPLGLPSPKPPRKFNLKSPAQPSCSSAMTPDSLNIDVVKDWGEPLRLPSPAPVTNEISNKGAPGTPKKERKQARKVQSENIKNKKRSESPGKNEKKMKDSKNKIQPVYMDLAYVPHHGNSYYTSLEFFKRVRARYYVFSGTEPSREVYDALLEAKKTWEDKDLEVTMIPTYDTDTLGYWVADNEEALAANHIDLSPSASRCTINLQDHETSCSAYRLEF